MSTVLRWIRRETFMCPFIILPKTRKLCSTVATARRSASSVVRNNLSIHRANRSRRNGRRSDDRYRQWSRPLFQRE